MMRYEQFLELRRLMDVEKCSAARIAEVMNLNIKTVLAWADRLTYPARLKTRRKTASHRMDWL
jgi:hypothetical protein